MDFGMTKIRITAIKTLGGNALHVACEGCGHDDYHQPFGPRLFAGLTDAIYRAEQMYADHLYGAGRNVKECPIRDFAWERS